MNLVKSGGVYEKVRQVYQNSITGEIDFSLITDVNAFIYPGTNNWTSSSRSRIGTKLISVKQNSTYKIKANSSQKTYYAFLSEYPVIQQAVQYADGYTEVLTIEINEEIKIDAPQNAKYLYIVNYDKGQSPSIFLPDYLYYLYEIDNEVTLESNKLVSSDAVAKKIGNLTNLGETDLSICQNYKGFIDTSGKWHVSNNFNSKIIQCVPNTIFTIYANNEKNSYICFLKEFPTFTHLEQLSLAKGYNGTEIVPAGGSYDFVTPIDAKYLYILYDGDFDYHPVKVNAFVNSNNKNTIEECGLNSLFIEDLNDKFSSEFKFRDIDLTKGRLINGFLNVIDSPSWKLQSSKNVRSLVIPVTEFSTYKIKVVIGQINFGILSTLTPEDEIIYAPNENGKRLSVGENIIKIPKGATSIVLTYSILNDVYIEYIKKQVFETDLKECLNFTLLDLNSFTEEDGYLAPSPNRWNSSTSVKSIIIPVNGRETYILENNASMNIGILATMVPQDVVMAEGENVRQFMDVGEHIINTPSDAVCICAVYKVSGTTLINSVKKKEDSISVFDGVYSENCYLITDGSLVESENFKITDYIPTFNNKKIKISMLRAEGTDNDTGILFYDKELNVIEDSFTNGFCNKNQNNEWMKYIDIYIPNKASYFRITTFSDSFAETNNIDNRIKYNFYHNDESNYITKGFIKNEFQENVIKRARQFANIRWTPVADLPRACNFVNDYSNSEAFWGGTYIDTFKANKEYVGVPYSFAGRNDLGGNPFANSFGRFALEVGHDVPFEAFITAARNLNSFLYDKSLPNLINYGALALGADCVGMASYAMNWVYSNRIAQDFRSDDLTDVIGNVSTMDLSLIHPADFLVCGFHTALITDVYYENGELMIEVGEENSEGGGSNTPVYSGLNGGLSYRKLYNAEDFRSWCRIYTIRRLKNFAKYEIPYIPNQFAPIEDFPLRKPIVDLACMPYMGNSFRFKVGYIPDYTQKVLVNANGFTKLVVKKDNVILNEYTIDNNTEYVNVPFSEVGTYTAYLETSDGLKSRTCTWYVD